MTAASVASAHATTDSIVEIERMLIDGLLITPGAIESVRAFVSEEDFCDHPSRLAFRAFARSPEIDGLVGLVEDLAANGEGEMAGGQGAIIAAFGNDDVGPTLLPGLAEDVLKASLERQMRAAARRVERDPADRDSLAVLFDLRERFEGRRAITARHAIELDDISFSGDTLMALLQEPAPDPVYPGVPPDGHFSLMIAPSFSGKTSLVLWVAMARIRGQAPWIGAPAREPGRVLFYSLDEAPGQVAHRIASLAKQHPAGKLFSQYAHRFTITGPHRTVDTEKLERLKFTSEGLATLKRFLAEAQAAGDPFTDVIIDSYGDVKASDDAREDQNDQAARIGGALERMAVAYGCAIEMIHHTGKPVPGADAPDPRDMGLGASQLSAKARAIFTCEEEVGLSNVRKIRTRTNLTENPAPLMVEVAAGRSDRQRIDFFRPHDPATAYPIAEYVQHEDDWISLNELARRLGGLEDGKTPPRNLKDRARELRGIWANAGLCETRTGGRNALELRRA